MKRFHTNQDHHRDGNRNEKESCAASHSDGRSNPKTGSRGQAVNYVLLKDNNATPDKAHARYDLRRNTRRIKRYVGRVSQHKIEAAIGKHHKQRTTLRNE